MIEVIAQANENATQIAPAFTAVDGFFGVLFIFTLGWLIKIHGAVSKLEGIHGASMFEKKSPLSLTETGEKILTESGVKKYIDLHKDGLLKEFEGMKNAFDIQQKAREVIKKEFGKSDFDEAKNYLYNEGKEFDETVVAAGIYLRDIVLEERGHKKGVEA